MTRSDVVGRSLVLFGVLLLAACGSRSAADSEAVVIAPTAELDVVERVGETPGVDIFSQALTASGVGQELERGGPYTIFAPRDEAFESLGQGVAGSLFDAENRPALVELVRRHVVAGEIDSGDMGRTRTYDRLAGPQIVVQRQDGQTLVNSAHLVAADLEATNGVVHVIDQVFQPDAQIVVRRTAEVPAGGMEEILERDGRFTTFLAALRQTGMDERLSDPGPITVYAPTETAFGALPLGTLSRLSQPMYQAQLRSLLAAHIVPGLQPSSARGDAEVVVTDMGGQQFTMPASQLSSSSTVDGRPLVDADYRAANGVIHITDRLIVPPGFSAGFPAGTATAPAG